jgi:CubicO group peptidase (beta-lactamase class C family)
MQRNLSVAESILRASLGRVFGAAQLEVRQGGRTLLSQAYGWLDPETRDRPANQDTLFDLASVTKLFVATAFMILVEEGRVGLDQPVATVLPEFCGVRPIQPYEDPLVPGSLVTVDAIAPAADWPTAVDAGVVTFRNLLAHNSGLPAWRPLFRQPTAEAGRQLALATFFSYPPGARSIYSDIGLILIGLAIERLTGLRLDDAVYRRVTGLLGLERTRYLPIGAAAPTEFCAWRGRRIAGEVHDENAAGLGGIAGHAGLFSTAHDVAAFGQSFLAPGSILNSAVIAEMTRVQAQDGFIRRGLGFALWSPDPEASGNPFSQAAFGHTGFTGTSLWIDPGRELVVACLTNRVYYGRHAAGILAFRVALHRAIVEAL